jgi:SAM-dependent methyltransferase
VIIIYGDFAFYYDRLMQTVDYAAWADYIHEIAQRNKISPGLAVDLGCGTGSFCIEMSKRGYDMIGIDKSAEMLSCAKDKSLKAGKDILFLNQDMTDFELYGTVDIITCLMDSVNYVTYKNDLKRLFRLVKNYLNPQGLFIFDINTKYKFENVFSANVFCETGEDVSYIWQNNYDRRSKLCSFELSFFVREGELYKRFDEVHYERCYTIDELKSMLESVGLEFRGIYSELSFKRPSEKCERIFVICRKK